MRSIRRFLVMAAIVGMIVSGCGTAPVSSAVPPASAVPILLRDAPPSIGCDAIGVPYKSVTIRIDASAADQVWAVTDQNERLDVFWAVGFVGGTAAEPVVVDPQGKIVARDGEQIVLPEQDWPRLNGYFVCPGPTAIHVLLQDPA